VISFKQFLEAFGDNDEDYEYGANPETGEPFTKAEYIRYKRWTRDKVVELMKAKKDGDREKVDDIAWALINHGIGLSHEDLTLLHKLINEARS